MALPNNAMFKISGDTTDNPALPIFTNSDITGDYGAGLLIDFDFADPDGAGGYTGAFANGDVLINSAWEHVARRLIPGATQASMALTIQRVGAAAELAVERTAKGYPHIVLSNVGSLSTSVLRFMFPAAIVAYILANPTHIFEATQSERLTRASTKTTNPGNGEAVIQNSATYTNDHLFRFEGPDTSTSGERPNGAKLLGRTFVPDFGTTLDEGFKSVVVNGISGTAGASLNNAWWGWGGGPGATANTYRSSVPRRFTLEDKTVSQACLAAAIAAGVLTSELHDTAGTMARGAANQAMRKASTDYYSGDTFTAPSTLLA